MIRVLFHLVDPGENDEEFHPIATYMPLIRMLIDDVVRAFDLDGLLLVDLTADGLGANLRFEGIDWHRFESLADAEAMYPDATWVYFEQGGQPLSSFIHPAGDVIYAFGPDTVGIALEAGRTYVDIDAVGQWGLYAAVAATVAFAHRAWQTSEQARR